MKKQVFGKECMYANHMFYAVEYVSGRVRPKMRKSKIRETNQKINPKYYRKSDANNLKKTWKNDSKMEPQTMEKQLKTRSGK